MVSDGQLGQFPHLGVQEGPQLREVTGHLAVGQEKVEQKNEPFPRTVGTTRAAPGGSAWPEAPGLVIWPLVGDRAWGEEHRRASEQDRACSLCPSYGQ